MWGKSMWLDAVGCDSDQIRSYTNIQRFAKRLVEEIDMVAHGDPTITHFGDGNKEGYTLVQLIETSNISAHFANESDSMFLDVFSCKDFDPVKVIETTEKFFGGAKFLIRWGIVERG